MWSSGASASNTVGFWCLAMLTHTPSLWKRGERKHGTQGSLDEFCHSLPNHVLQYFRFVETRRLEGTDVPGAKKIVAIFVPMQRGFPLLVSPVAGFLIKMLGDEDAPVDLQSLTADLQLATKTALFKC